MNNPIIVVIKKEFMDKFKSSSILILSILFAVFTLLASYFSSFGQGWQDFDVTIGIMNVPTQFLIPILGLILGYATIVGEIESGSMAALMSYPIKRWEIVIGKFLGLGSVISTTMLIGFGLAGLIIALNVSDPNYGLFLLFISSSILLGLTFIGISMFFSSILKRRTTSIITAIFLWIFFVIIFPMIVGIAAVLTNPEIFSSPEIALGFIFPDWYYWSLLFNPITTHSLISDQTQIIISEYWIVTSLLVWTFIPLIIGIIAFQKRDV